MKILIPHSEITTKIFYGMVNTTIVVFHETGTQHDAWPMHEDAQKESSDITWSNCMIASTKPQILHTIGAQAGVFQRCRMSSSRKSN